MAQVIDFATKKYWRECGDNVIANFVWWLKFETAFCESEGEVFVPPPEFKEMWKEVTRRAKCGNMAMKEILTGDIQWLTFIRSS